MAEEAGTSYQMILPMELVNLMAAGAMAFLLEVPGVWVVHPKAAGVWAFVSRRAEVWSVVLKAVEAGISGVAVLGLWEGEPRAGKAGALVEVVLLAWWNALRLAVSSRGVLVVWETPPLGL